MFKFLNLKERIKLMIFKLPSLTSHLSLAGKILLSLSLTVFLGCSGNDTDSATDIFDEYKPEYKQTTYQSPQRDDNYDLFSWQDHAQSTYQSPQRDDNYDEGVGAGYQSVQQGLSKSQLSESSLILRIEELKDATIRFINEIADENNLLSLDHVRCAEITTDSIDADLHLPSTSIYRYRGSDAYITALDEYEVDLDRLRSQWNDCLEQANENNQISSQELQGIGFDYLQKLREITPLIPNSSDRELVREFIDFGEDMILSNNTRCQNQINSDPDFLNLQHLSQNFQNRKTEFQQTLNLIKRKWDRCVKLKLAAL